MPQEFQTKLNPRKSLHKPYVHFVVCCWFKTLLWFMQLSLKSKLLCCSVNRMLLLHVFQPLLSPVTVTITVTGLQWLSQFRLDPSNRPLNVSLLLVSSDVCSSSCTDGLLFDRATTCLSCCSFELLLTRAAAHLCCCSFVLLLIQTSADSSCFSFEMLLIRADAHSNCCSFALLLIRTSATFRLLLIWTVTRWWVITARILFVGIWCVLFLWLERLWRVNIKNLCHFCCCLFFNNASKSCDFASVSFKCHTEAQWN